MRILVDIGDTEIVALDAMARKREQARALLIREAISDYLAKHSTAKLSEAFGVWVSPSRDGLAYQEEIRSEW